MAFFVPPAQAIIHKELNLLYQVTTTPQSTPISPQFWIHTELVSSLGPLEYVLNTASHHRVHHGANRWATIPYHGLPLPQVLPGQELRRSAHYLG